MASEIRIFSVSPSLKHWPVALAGAGFVAATGVVMMLLQLLPVVVGLAVVCVGLALTVRPALKAGNTRYDVTNARIVTRSGLLRKTETSLPLSEVRDIRIEWGNWGRALDVATLVVQGLGDTVVMEGVEEPEKVRGRIIELK